MADAAVETGTRRRLPPEERRAQLLRLAIEVFAARGLGAARHAEIAERAGVAVSTVFVYFPTREKLVEAVLDEVARFFIGLIERVHGQEKPAELILREMGEAFLDVLRSDRDYVLIWLEWGAAVREDVWPRYRAFTEECVRIMQRTLERGQREGSVAPDSDTESVARLLASSSQSIARLALGEVDRSTIDRFRRTVLTVALAPEPETDRI